MDYRRYSCGHVSARRSTSHSGQTDNEHPCRTCTREECQNREGDIKRDNSAAKTQLKAYINQASEQLEAIRKEEPRQIRAAWAIYHRLFGGKS